jgi:hypothetical protein
MTCSILRAAASIRGPAATAFCCVSQHVKKLGPDGCFFQADRLAKRAKKTQRFLTFWELPPPFSARRGIWRADC